MSRRHIFAILGSILLAASAVLMIWQDGGVSAASTTVNVADDQFVTANITITAGDTVTWDWTGSHQHTVTFEDASILNTGIQTQPFSASHQFDTPGTFAYYCQVHGAPGSGMSGTIVVQAAAAPTETPTTAATATSTPAATETPARATATLAGSSTPTNTPVPPVVNAGTAVPGETQAVGAPTRAGGAEAAQLPRTGDGARSGGRAWLLMALGVAGLALLALGLAWARRV